MTENKLQTPELLRALLFDVDGVIADTEPTHLRLFQRVLGGEGIPLTQEDYYGLYLALDDKTCFERILAAAGRDGSAEKVKELMAKKGALFADEAAKGLKIYPGVAEFVRRAATKYHLAVASGALRSEVETILKQAGIRGNFKAVIGADDCAKCKPDPEPYWKAMDRLNAAIMPASAVLPFECAAVEDSLHGIEAARNAGMRCIAVANTYPAEKLGRADWVVGSLAEVDMEELASRFAPT